MFDLHPSVRPSILLLPAPQVQSIGCSPSGRQVLEGVALVHWYALACVYAVLLLLCCAAPHAPVVDGLIVVSRRWVGGCQHSVVWFLLADCLRHACGYTTTATYMHAMVHTHTHTTHVGTYIHLFTTHVRTCCLGFLLKQRVCVCVCVCVARVRAIDLSGQTVEEHNAEGIRRAAALLREGWQVSSFHRRTVRPPFVLTLLFLSLRKHTWRVMSVYHWCVRTWLSAKLISSTLVPAVVGDIHCGRKLIEH